MDKKEAKLLYLKMRLDYPTVPDWEKKEIRQRLGINLPATESDFTAKTGDELFHFVFNYLDEQLSAIRRNKRTNSAFDYLSDSLKTIYHLSNYSANFESDSLEQIYEYEESVDDMRRLSQAFRTIDRIDEATLIDSVLNKGQITDNDVELLQQHFWESDNAVEQIESAIESYIKGHIGDLLNLQEV